MSDQTRSSDSHVPDTSASDSLPRGPERYELLSEIARGGQGVVLEAHDNILNRTVAVKVLKEGFSPQSAVGRRFLDEAQITGQLQHPGIPPIHDLGTLPDGRPFLAMKLIKGQTLDALLKARPDPTHDRGRFVAVFEQICQALGYAHAHHVIHRDLKPANVMVGAFGEVQVMDWGLAKVLTDRASAAVEMGHAEMTAAMSEIESNRDADSETKAGSVLGTPAYMPPEQAIGAIDEINQRSDVFGLGAILCAILTGKPPFVAGDSESTRKLAARGSVEEAFSRLDDCGADAELVALCKECLAATSAKRPQHAGVVAERLAAYQGAVQERLRQAELERAAAQVRAISERRARRLTLSLAAAILLLMMGGGGVIWIVQHQREAAAARQQEADNRARERMEQAEKRLQSGWETQDFRMLADAQAQADQAAEIASGGSEAVQNETLQLQNKVKARLAAAQDNRTLLAELLDVTSPPESTSYTGGDGGAMLAATLPNTEEQYIAVLRRWGVDLERDPLDRVAARFREQPRMVIQEIVAALDLWAEQPLANKGRLLDLADRLDEDSRSRELRQMSRSGALAAEQAQKLNPPGPNTRRLWELAESTDPVRDPVLWLLVLARALERTQSPHAEAILRSGLTARPDEVAFHVALGQLLERQQPPRWSGAAEHYRAARSLRPEMGLALGKALLSAGRGSESTELLRELVRRQPRNPEIQFYLGHVLGTQKKQDEAVAAYRKAIELRSDLFQAYYNLGCVLAEQNKMDEAADAFRQFTKLQPNLAPGHYNLGWVLYRQRKFEEAADAWRKAIELRPDDAASHYNLGNTLTDLKKLDEAVAAYRKAIQLRPSDTRAYNNLGIALHKQRKWNEAAEVYRSAIALHPDDAKAYYNLSHTLYEHKKLDEAVTAYRKAIELQPSLGGPQDALGKALASAKNLDDPSEAAAFVKLGDTLRTQKKVDEAIVAYRKAIALNPEFADAYERLGNVLRTQKRWEEAVAAGRKLVELRPEDPGAYFELGNALNNHGRRDEAIAACRKAVELRPDFAEGWCNLGIFLRDDGQFVEGLAAIRKGHELGSKRSNWTAPSAIWVRGAETLVDLDARLPAILRGELPPKDNQERLALADLCQRYKKQYAAAARFHADAFASDPKLAEDLRTQHRYNAARWAVLAAAGQGEDGKKLDNSARTSLRQQARDWLRADLTIWSNQAISDNPNIRALAQQTLQRWQMDPDLAACRDPDALAKLPADERDAWSKLWGEVETVRERAASKR